ncbi:hypothetical protein ACFOOJ_05220 [Sphingobium xenophagum]|uniref:hypothetical protein n=1 Tax=Sphingobium xenophagum TaxID=121428 RepID=UPI001FD3323B|nr:hypothetical protein [Sphingobium xenophagum]
MTKMSSAGVDDPLPDMRGHVAIAAFAAEAGIDHDDHVRPFIWLAAAMPCEFGLRTAEPVSERRVAEIFRRINQQAPADMRAIRRVIRWQGSRRRGAGGWALQRYAQGLAGGLNVDPVGKDDAASPAKFTRARP